jgi:hypothetical protein
MNMIDIPLSASPLDTHKCPVKDCLSLVDRKYLMCPQHWALLPKPLQQAVWISWREVNKDKIYHNYREARQNAIDHVNNISRSTQDNQ